MIKCDYIYKKIIKFINNLECASFSFYYILFYVLACFTLHSMPIGPTSKSWLKVVTKHRALRITTQKCISLYLSSMKFMCKLYICHLNLFGQFKCYVYYCKISILLSTQTYYNYDDY